jgi:eukaryotic-like serine/threonine-protein kinase
MGMASATDTSVIAAPEPSDRASEVQRRIGVTVAGSYRIVRHIGSGSSGHVFSAEHARLGKRVAVKLLRAEAAGSERAVLRFRREAKTVARLQHEHIVSVIDCGELQDQTPYLVMELLEGEDLRSLLQREGALPTRRAIQLVIEACRALTAVHAAGLVHRDLKPENLFITRRCTGEDWCKVLDFGVAKLDASLATAQDTIIGTVRYMAPEQLSDSRAVDPTTDVYALGAILYECLAGTPLWGGATVQETMYQIMNRAPTPLIEHRPNLPLPLTQIVHRAIEKSQDRRPQSAAEFAKLLLGALGAPATQSAVGATVSDANSSHVARPPKSTFSQRRVFALACCVALGTSLGLSMIVRPGVATKPQSPSKAQDLQRAANQLEPSHPATAAMASVTVASGGQPPTLFTATAISRSASLPPARDAAKPGNRRDARSVASEPVLVRVGGFDSSNPYGADE